MKMILAAKHTLLGTKTQVRRIMCLFSSGLGTPGLTRYRSRCSTEAAQIEHKLREIGNLGKCFLKAQPCRCSSG